MKKPYQLSATEAAKKIQANQLSSEELLRSCIERIEEKESSTQAWVETNFKAALERARYLDRSANQGLFICI
jgi:Asp-tRNA(Asn)/Glu-tRNA(Gln) amidotransferase A subunit family amidase